MTMKNDSELLDNFALERNLKDTTKEQYRIVLELYTKFNKKTMLELLQEAEDEEEERIRWGKRKLRKRLLEFRTHMAKEGLKKSYIKTTFGRVLTFYRHYGFEIHKLPLLSDKNLNDTPPITIKDLPNKEIIKQALDICDVQKRALILFMSSSGCARRETLSLTIQDFINATRDYHNSNDIYEIIDLLKGKEDIVPTFEILREKTNKYYYTFCSPEATSEIINYLSSVDYSLNNNQKIFPMAIVTFTRYFEEINDKLNLGKKGPFRRFRSHMLRKFHASSLKRDGLSIDEINSMQGKSRNSTDEAYFFDDPIKLREKYIEHLDCLTINLDVNNINIKSPEYLELEQKYNEKEDQFNNMEERLSRMEKMFGNVDQMSDDEILNLFSKRS